MPLSQLVAIDNCARIACYVVEDAALDKPVFARVAEGVSDVRLSSPALVARDFPSLREQLLDR